MSYLTDGHPTLISFSLSPTVKFKEIGVTPPGLDAGGPNDTTTMRNTAYRTMQPKHLVTLTPMTATCEYDPDCYDSIVADLLGENGQITVTFPDESTLTFWGWLDKFMPGELKEGTMPTATVTIQPSNQNNSNVEVPPVYAA
jgi:hypothetical protein